MSPSSRVSSPRYISLAAQRQYWRDTLAGVPSKPGFRTDFELSAGLNSPGKYIRVVVPQKLTQSLESLALACAATLFTVGMAAWQVHHHCASSSNYLQSYCCRTVITDIRNQLGLAEGTYSPETLRH